MNKLLMRALLLLACAALALNATAADLTLRYRQPAPDTHEGWEREALPIGNGRLGAMLFGQLARERVQFNDITLWTGDAKLMGAYQPFGDVFIELVVTSSKQRRATRVSCNSTMADRCTATPWAASTTAERRLPAIRRR